MAVSLKYYISNALVNGVEEKEKERERARARKREREKRRKKPKKCVYVRVRCLCTHRIGKKKREKGAVCSLARLSCAIHFSEQARKHKWPCMYHDGMRDA